MNANASSGVREETVRIFVSYAREDQRWLNPAYQFNLIPFLAESLRRYNVTFWDDKKLVGGDEFKRLILQQIDGSQIALLIVSQDFLNSSFIESVEIQRIAERVNRCEMVVVPVLVGPCDWNDDPFLAARQMVPSSVPLIKIIENEADWANVKMEILKGLKTQVRKIRGEEPPVPPQTIKPTPPPVRPPKPKAFLLRIAVGMVRIIIGLILLFVALGVLSTIFRHSRHYVAAAISAKAVSASARICADSTSDAPQAVR